MNVGLLRSHDTPIAAVSPDGVAILKCTPSDNFPDSSKLVGTVSSNDTFAFDVDNEVSFIFSMEYKHKSTLITSSKSREIVSDHLGGKRLTVLDLGSQQDH